MPETKELKLFVSSSPHIQSDTAIPKIMYEVLLALLPATLMGIYFFGLGTLKVIGLSIAGAMLSEALIQKIRRQDIMVTDGSAAITGLLLALTLPSNSPWWMVCVGAVAAIVLGKQLYGGLGWNPFNPALVGRVVLLISWPVQMTAWPKPTPLFSHAIDAVTAATPLGILKMEKAAAIVNISRIDLLLGYRGGSLGEVSILAIILGGLYLLFRGHITWHIPGSYLLTVALFTGVFRLISPAEYASPLFHLLTGGLMLGAFFMATDYVTSPVTRKGQLVFGFGCGLLTGVIRLFGNYPEGVSFAILLMNSVTPLIDKYIRPTTFGKKQPE